MDPTLLDFKDYLEKTRHLARNSVSAYLRDINEFGDYMRKKNGVEIKYATEADVSAWLLALKQEDKSAATVNRKLASVRAYYRFTGAEGITSSNPSTQIKTPKIARKKIEFLTIEEVERLLAQPDNSVKGIRDLAMLELLYATGLRVSELIGTNIEDVNLRVGHGFVTCNGEHGKARIIPIGRPARAALEEYIYEGRAKLLRKKNVGNNALFLSYYGDRMTRQALWKILKDYARQAGIEKKITPQTLRNSFAVHMVQNGADLESLQKFLGHENLSATQIYLAFSKSRIKDVYDSSHPRA